MSIKQTITKATLMSTIENFDKMAHFVSSKRAVYTIIKNAKKYQGEYDALIKASEFEIEGFEEYKNDFLQVAQEYAQKDESGNIKWNEQMTGFFVQDASKQEETNDKIKEVNEKHKDVLDKRVEMIKDYNNLLNEEIEVEFDTISLNDLPDVVDKDKELEYKGIMASLFEYIVE